jgi:hypothetical protein
MVWPTGSSFGQKWRALEIFEPKNTLAVIKALLCFENVAEVAPRGCGGISLAKALLAKPLGLSCYVGLDFGGEIRHFAAFPERHVSRSSLPNTYAIAMAMRRQRLGSCTNSFRPFVSTDKSALCDCSPTRPIER